MPSSGIEYLARVQILQNFGKVYQEQVLEQVTESAVGCSFFTLFHSYSLAVGGDIAEWDFMVISHFSSPNGVYYEQVLRK